MATFNTKESLKGLTSQTEARTARISSWDHSGLNADYFIIPPHSSLTIFDVEGPGCITHLWFVQTCRKLLGPGALSYTAAGNPPLLEIPNASGLNFEINDPDYYRKVLLKMCWDDSEEPSVLAPLGDFFCVGHSMPNSFSSAFFTVSARPQDEKKFGGAAALNCYLPMPFQKRAKIDIVNEGEEFYCQYFHVDHEIYAQPLQSDVLYFHAHWRRENPTNGWAPSRIQVNGIEAQSVPNLDGKDNYVILEAEGKGHYVGCNQSVAHFQGTWFGEGDDMIWIDDDFDDDGQPTWPPSIHRTGTEDYFGHGWGMQKNAFPFCGSIIHESEVENYQVSYRWHVVDPVRFHRKIKVTMESGHANHLRDDWSTTSYWYQTLPGPKLQILPVEQRLPRRPQFPGGGFPSEPDLSALDALRRAVVESRDERMREFAKDRAVSMIKRAEESRERAIKNIEVAREVRRRYLCSLARS